MFKLSFYSELINNGQTIQITNSIEVGFLVITDQNAMVGIYCVNYGSLTMLSGSRASATKDNANTMNVYKTSNGRTIDVQNNTGINSKFEILAFGH